MEAAIEYAGWQHGWVDGMAPDDWGNLVYAASTSSVPATSPGDVDPPPQLGTLNMPLLCLAPKWLSACVVMALLSVPCLTGVAAAQASDAEFSPLFDGKSFAGWHGRPHIHPADYEKATEEQKAKWAAELKTHWSIEGDELVNDGHGAYMTTDESFGDMELKLKYKTVPLADSGIYLRGTPQVQIWDFTEEAKFKLGANLGSGGLWNNSPGAPGKDPLVKADRPFGEWNEMEILQVGARTTVKLNGQLVVDHAIMENYWDRSLPLAVRGPIQLQTHGGEIRWKDIQVRRIGADEANQILASKANDGFTSLFDGQSLAGWKGAVDDYQVVDGAIQCREGRGGNLFTEGEYANYVVRVEFQLPPAGNNGLAIHYPGKGGPAYDGLTELQVLDGDHEKYTKMGLDDRQHHGSAYGLVAAARGHLREIGQWNFQEVTVRGSHVKVELNGSVILDADLSKVTEFMADSPHPGLVRRSGHFGFAGHSDPVRFRNVQIRELPAE